MHGFLLVNKPYSWTSFDVVKHIKKVLKSNSQNPLSKSCKISKVGHTGTLDPIARGLLIICIGKYTKLSSSMMSKEKEYLATIRFGEARDTDDTTGTIISKRTIPELSETTIKEALQDFMGEILQIPPMYSALKLKGVPLYKLARKGKVIDRKPRKVQIFEIELQDYTPPLLKIRVVCGKGTYIRAIARDLGEKLGCGGCMEALTRTRIGEFKLSQAIDPKSISSSQDIENLLISDTTIEYAI